MRKVIICCLSILTVLLIFSVFVLFALENIPVQSNIALVGSSEKKHQSQSYDNGETLIAQDETILSKEELVMNEWHVIDQWENPNEELQFYAKENVYFEDGLIIISSRKENRGNKEYTSGIVESNDSFLYGSFTFNIVVSNGKGLFPAIWMLPQDNDAYPEIDIFEMIGNEPFNFYGVIHYGNEDGTHKEYYCYEVKPKNEYSVGIRWEKNKLSWYIDNQCIYQTSNGVPNEPMYIIINQAVGGVWPGNPDDMTIFPAVFIVEPYVINPEQRANRW
jgi:beta-glucanase (GH16 family)